MILQKSKINVERRWNDITLVYVFNLYGKEWRSFDKCCLLFKTLDAHLHQIPSLIVELMSLQRKIKSKK
jgi:hypothetical protein